MKRILVLAAAALSLITPPALAANKPKGCATVLVSADETQDDKPGNGKQFSATQILDVKLRAVVPPNVGMEPGDVVTFLVMTPSRGLYQQIDVPVAPSGSSEGERTLPGYPFPVRTQNSSSVTVNGQKAQAFGAKLLVAGTQIMENGLYGTWTVEASFANGPPCSASFTLKP
jgi:hypothetical protein